MSNRFEVAKLIRGATEALEALQQESAKGTRADAAMQLAWHNLMDAAALTIHGKFAWLNFPRGVPS